jgi:aspartyl-tRNA(Asn)/glutamyl-tRNA(Gln) amidotransferase subunit A
LDDLLDLSIQQLGVLLSTREASTEEIVRAALARIKEVEPTVNAFISVDEDRALREALEVDAARVRGDELGPLAGIPIAIKDNICTKRLATTAGSRMLAEFVPPYDATVVERLHRAGMIVIGKTNMDEFAMGSSTETSYFRPTRNPWDTTRVPGGTSGGSAAAVAAREVPVSLGSDTGGSIRQPAAFCGVVGLKPTYGRVSRYGLIAYVSSFDQIGVLSKTVADCASVTSVIAGYDPLDSTSLQEPVPAYETTLSSPLDGLRIGIPREYVTDVLETGTRAAIEQAVRWLEENGATCGDVSLPSSAHAIPAYYVIATSEASSNLARYDGVKYGFRSPDHQDMWHMLDRTRAEGFGSEVKRRILLGTFALSAGYYDAYYLKAQKVRTLIKRDYDLAFQQFDALLMPVSPFGPWAIGEKVNDPLSMYLADVHTVTANLAGIPALSLPVGHDSAGLPTAVQLQGPALSEGLLLRVAQKLEESRGSYPSPAIDTGVPAGGQGLA